MTCTRDDALSTGMGDGQTQSKHLRGTTASSLPCSLDYVATGILVRSELITLEDYSPFAGLCLVPREQIIM